MAKIFTLVNLFGVCQRWRRLKEKYDKIKQGGGIDNIRFFTNIPFEWPLKVYLSIGGEGGGRGVGLVPQLSNNIRTSFKYVKLYLLLL